MNSKELLKTLSIDEKLKLLCGAGDWHTFDCNGKVPSIMMTDGPHGLRKVVKESKNNINNSVPATCFPTASALAASWNPDLAYSMAGAIAKEAKKEQVSIVLGCGTNIKRSPLCGRNFEYFSEDPFLAGSMASSYIKGMQEQGVGTSLKHFAGNSQEKRRQTSNSEIDERALREIYLSAFETAVKEAAPTSVMASYNRVNGEYSCANEHLLKDILYGEWGYEGAVISDWGATMDAVKCYKAGMTLEMPDSKGYHFSKLKEAYEKGEITEAEIDEWAENVLSKLSSLAGRVVNNYKVDYEAQNRLAKEIESECAVLLKNEGVFPIDKRTKIFAIGEMGEHMRFQGGGSSHINPAMHKDALTALKDAGYDIHYSMGYQNNSEEDDSLLTDHAMKMLKAECDDNSVILFFLGLTDRYEGEGYDRTSFDIPKVQRNLLSKIVEKYGDRKIAVISFSGAPMDFSWEKDVNAILHMYLGGQAVGEAVAALVSGAVNPSGKLAETFPLSVLDTPASRYFAMETNDVEYRESIFVGYRYYESFDVPVRYPFGYGLSYTSFEYSDLRIEEAEEGFNAVFKIKNTGRRKGKETAQVYVLPPDSNFIRSKIELKGFYKVELEAGEECEIAVWLGNRAFSVYDVSKNDFSVINGEYTIAVGASVQDLRLKEKVFVEGEEYFRDERKLFPDYFLPQPHGMDIPREQFEALYGKELSSFDTRRPKDFDMTCSFKEVCKASFVGKLIRIGAHLGLSLMNFGKSKEDPAVKMLHMGIDEGALESLISNSGGRFNEKFAGFLLKKAGKR